MKHYINLWHFNHSIVEMFIYLRPIFTLMASIKLCANIAETVLRGGLQKAKQHHTAQQDLINHLMAEGYSQKESITEAEEIFSKSRTHLRTCEDQDDLEEKIIDDYDTITQTQIFLSDSTRLLPGYVAQAQFDFDISRWMADVLKREGHHGRGKWALRLLEFWYDHMPCEDRPTLLKQLFDDEPGSWRYFALYADKLAKHLSPDSEALEWIMKELIAGWDVMPLLSVLRPDDVPNDLWKRLEAWTVDDDIQECEGLIHVKHTNKYVGDCSILEWLHLETLFNTDKDMSGDLSLIHVDGLLVGSMKMVGDQSIVGLRTVRDAHGRYAMLTGGVYGTTNEIINKAKKAYRRQGKWARLELDSLPLLPLRFFGERGTDPGIEKRKQYASELKSIRETLS